MTAGAGMALLAAGSDEHRDSHNVRSGLGLFIGGSVLHVIGRTIDPNDGILPQAFKSKAVSLALYATEQAHNLGGRAVDLARDAVDHFRVRPPVSPPHELAAFDVEANIRPPQPAHLQSGNETS